MTGWDALARELDAWGEAGAVATLWWRDDDAVADTPTLRRLLSLAAATVLAATVLAVMALGLALITSKLAIPLLRQTGPAITGAKYFWRARRAGAFINSIRLAALPMLDWFLPHPYSTAVCLSRFPSRF